MTEQRTDFRFGRKLITIRAKSTRGRSMAQLLASAAEDNMLGSRVAAVNQMSIETAVDTFTMRYQSLLYRFLTLITLPKCVADVVTKDTCPMA